MRSTPYWRASAMVSVAAGLLLQGAELLLHGADVVVGGDRHVADAGDVAGW